MELEKRFSLATAVEIAEKMIFYMLLVTDRANIAGSIRREKPMVKDIELVVMPKFGVEKDLFENITGFVPSEEFIKLVNSLGTILKGKPDGKYMQILLPEGIKLDLFISYDASDYWRQFAIRTGSADYAHKVIATGWKNNGWVGSDKGLRRKYDCVEIKQENAASKWRCINPDGMRPPEWNSEEEFFQWLNVKWIEPRFREVLPKNKYEYEEPRN